MTRNYILSVTETELEEGRFFNSKLIDEKQQVIYLRALPYENFLAELTNG